MGLTRKEQLENVLKNLDAIAGVEGSAVVTKDGLIVVSDLKAGLNADTFAAMSATMFGAAETALEELKKGSIEMVITETRESRLVALESSQDCILVALVQEKADLGPILGELKKAAGEARKIIENE